MNTLFSCHHIVPFLHREISCVLSILPVTFVGKKAPQLFLFHRVHFPNIFKIFGILKKSDSHYLAKVLIREKLASTG